MQQSLTTSHYTNVNIGTFQPNTADNDNSCTLCRKIINEPQSFFGKHSNGKYRKFHDTCISCADCGELACDNDKVYIKDDKMYCIDDFYKNFASLCGTCQKPILSTHWVRKTESVSFHIACFVCHICNRQLTTNELFGLYEDKIFCQTDYPERHKVSNSCTPKKAKRNRTIFNDTQLEILQSTFSFDSNPDGPDLERISFQTGLTKRVTQVWFQNARARCKKQNSAFNQNNDCPETCVGNRVN